jgi:hypothetical protein
MDDGKQKSHSSGVVVVTEKAFGNLQVLEFGSFSRGNSDMGEDQSEFGYRLVWISA